MKHTQDKPGISHGGDSDQKDRSRQFEPAWTRGSILKRTIFHELDHREIHCQISHSVTVFHVVKIYLLLNSITWNKCDYKYIS